MGCIYKATSRTTGKSYIGMTMRTMRYRRYQHTSDRDTGVFHKAIRKYGKEDFVWEELYTCDDEEILYQKEIEFIELHKTHLPNGYNMAAGGRGSPRVAFTDERRYYNKQRALKRATPVYCVERDILYESLRKAIIETGVAKDTIWRSMEDVFRQVPKYHFCTPSDIEKYRALYKLGQLRYGKPPNSPEAIAQAVKKNTGRKQTPEHIEHMRRSKLGKCLPPKTKESVEKWRSTSLLNNSIKGGADSPVARVTINLTDGREFSTLTEAVKFYNLKPSAMGNISQCCRGLKLSAYGYKWAYKIA